MKKLLVLIILAMISNGFVVASSTKVDVKENDEILEEKNKLNTLSDDIIFRDDFDDFNTFWRVIQKFTSFDIHHGMAELTMWKAWRFLYSNCELRSPNIFKFNNLKIRAEVNNSWSQAGSEDEIQKGTVGWGYWNHKFNVEEIEYAWFFHIKGPWFFPNNGLWVICKSPKTHEHGGFSMIKIEGYDLTDWHEYEINWTENSVDFYIDGENVAHVTEGVPQNNMTVDIWLDNAAWHGFNEGDIYFPIPLRVRKCNMLFIDYVEVTQ